MIFGISEHIIHLVNEDFTLSIMLQAIETTLAMSLVAGGIGIIAVGIGFVKKSVPTTIVSAVLIASLMCNVVVSATSSKGVMYLLAIAVLSTAMLVIMCLLKTVNKMEVE